MKNHDLKIIRDMADGLPDELELINHSWVFDKKDMADIGVEIAENEYRKSAFEVAVLVNHYENMKREFKYNGTQGVARYSQNVIDRWKSGKIQYNNEQILHRVAMEMEALREKSERRSIAESWSRTWVVRIIKFIKSKFK